MYQQGGCRVQNSGPWDPWQASDKKKTPGVPGNHSIPSKLVYTPCDDSLRGLHPSGNHRIPSRLACEQEVRAGRGAPLSRLFWCQSFARKGVERLGRGGGVAALSASVTRSTTLVWKALIIFLAALGPPAVAYKKPIQGEGDGQAREDSQV